MLEPIGSVIPLLISIVSGIFYILALWTKSGQKKSFRFLTGGLCMMTTIAFSFQLAQDATGFSLIIMVICFIATLFIFGLAVWFGEE